MVWEVKGRSNTPLLKSSAMLRCSAASATDERSVMNLAAGGGSPGIRVCTTGALGVTSGVTMAIVAGGLVADGTGVVSTCGLGVGSEATRLEALQASGAAASSIKARARRRRWSIVLGSRGRCGLEVVAVRPGPV